MLEGVYTRGASSTVPRFHRLPPPTDADIAALLTRLHRRVRRLLARRSRAVYDSLLTARREALHRRVAETVERSYGERLGEWVEVLAHHWSRTSQTDKAVRYLG